MIWIMWEIPTQKGLSLDYPMVQIMILAGCCTGSGVNLCAVTDKHKQAIKRDILALDLVKDVGFADVSQYKKIPGGNTPHEFLSDAQTAIVYIVRLDDAMARYGTWYIVSLCNFLKRANDSVGDVLKKHGLHSCGVIDERDTGDLIGRISFRQLAVLAGLGTIGKNTCVLHPVYGPNILIGVVLTNSYIPCDHPSDTDVCLYCDICIRECRTGALTRDYLDRYTCKNKKKILGTGCGTLCVNSCPIG